MRFELWARQLISSALLRRNKVGDEPRRFFLLQSEYWRHGDEQQRIAHRGNLSGNGNSSIVGDHPADQCLQKYQKFATCRYIVPYAVGTLCALMLPGRKRLAIT